jgi:hypothetical protein
MSGAHDASSPIDSSAEKILVTALGYTRVHATAHAESNPGGPAGIHERSLQLERGMKRIKRVSKCGVDAISARFHELATIAFHRLSSNRVVARQGRPHSLGFLLPEAGASFDVGEEEGCDAGWR